MGSSGQRHLSRNPAPSSALTKEKMTKVGVIFARNMVAERNMIWDSEWA
jgi:hypothetical protein